MRSTHTIERGLGEIMSMNKLISFLTILSLLSSNLAWSVGRIQNEDVKSQADITSAVLTTTGNLTISTPCISSIGALTNLGIGQFIYDTTNPTYISSGTTIAGIPGTCSAGQVQMSTNATHSATGDTITFGGQVSQLINLTKTYDTTDSLRTDLALSGGYFGQYNVDNLWQVSNNADTTKKLEFSLGGMTTAKVLTISSSQSTTQSLAIPNVSSGDTIVTNNTSATLTNKTLSAGGTNLIGSTSITGTTGTGSVVFATTPTLVTPVLGAASGTSLTLSGSGTALTLSSGAIQSSGANNLFNKSASVNGLGGGIEATNASNTFSGILSDGGGRILRLGTSDFNSGTNTGSVLSFNTGAASGNTYATLQMFNSGTSVVSGTILSLQPNGGQVGISTTTPNATLQVSGYSGSPTASVITASGAGSDLVGTYNFRSSNTGWRETATNSDFAFDIFGSGTWQNAFYVFNSGHHFQINGALLMGVGQISGSPGQGEIGLANSNAIRWRNAAGTAYLNAMYVDGSNNLQLGGGGATNNMVMSVAGTGAILTLNTSQEAVFDSQIITQPISSGNNPTSGQGDIYSTSANGITIQGNGSSFDISFFNHNGSNIAQFDTPGNFYIPNTGSSSGSDFLCWTSSNGKVTFSSACTASSIKIKKNIEDLNDGLKTVMALHPITYELKPEYNSRKMGRQIGFIAEEVEKVEPKLTTAEEHNDIIGVRYDKVTPILTKAIQEQQSEIQELKEEIKLLKEKLGE